MEVDFERRPSDATPASAQQEAPPAFKMVDYEREDIRPTKKRYLVLFLFCLHSMINALQWIYLSSITNLVASYYRVDNMAVNWTSIVYMLVYIPLIVPATWLFERIGMRNSILLGSLGTTLGSLLKCFSCHPNLFYLLMTGQVIVAVCQLFVLSVPPRLASVWFPDHQVGLANACGVFGNQLGVALGFVIPQLVIGDGNHQLIDPTTGHRHTNLAAVERGLFNMFTGVALVSGLTSLLIGVCMDHEPSRPPGLARLQQIKQESGQGAAPLVPSTTTGAEPATTRPAQQVRRAHFGALLWHLISDLNFNLLMVGYGLNVGVFYALSTVLNQMIAPTWPDAGLLVGRLGLVMVVAGMFGSVISGYILDKTRLYRPVNTALYLLSLLSMLLFTLTLQQHNVATLYLAVALLGYFMTGYLLIGYEMSNEITWPLPESVTAGLLNLSAQVFGMLLTYAGSYIVDHHGNLLANLFFTLSIFLGALATVMIKAQLKRQSAIGA